MKSRPACEREYDFTLVLSGVTDLTPEVLNALFEAGCDDATPSTCQGRAFLDFTRAAPTLKDALLSAIDDVRKAGIGADVLRIDECDLVTQSEIAHKIDRSRQQVHQYINGERGPGGFPPPVCRISEEHDSRLWYWREVAGWLHKNNLIAKEAFQDAMVASLVNNALEMTLQQRTHPKLAKEILNEICIGGSRRADSSATRSNGSRSKKANRS
jgi:hypothetical protein